MDDGVIFSLSFYLRIRTNRARLGAIGAPRVDDVESATPTTSQPARDLSGPDRSAMVGVADSTRSTLGATIAQTWNRGSSSRTIVCEKIILGGTGRSRRFFSGYVGGRSAI